jgi:hypothetical protein
MKTSLGILLGAGLGLSACNSEGGIGNMGPPLTDASGRTCRYINETTITKGKETSDTVKLCKGPSGWVSA